MLNLSQNKQNAANAEAAGYPRLTAATNLTYKNHFKHPISSLSRLYLEKRGPDFEQRMHDILVVYKQVSLQFDENGNVIIPADGIKTVTLSYDEKPGILPGYMEGHDYVIGFAEGKLYRGDLDEVPGKIVRDGFFSG